MSSEEDHREPEDLSGLNECYRLEQLVECAESAGKNNERDGVLDEHRLANEEVPEVHKRVDVGIRSLLERKLDVASDRSASSEVRALVCSFHDAGACASDDIEPRLGEQSRDIFRRLIHRVLGRDSR